jgi:hypothetical protein
LIAIAISLVAAMHLNLVVESIAMNAADAVVAAAAEVDVAADGVVMI